MSEKKKLNMSGHVLVPEHTLLGEKEAKSVLEKYKIKASQLPFIKSSDPAARAIKAKPGDMIKVIRDSPTAGKSVAYRYVIEG